MSAEAPAAAARAGSRPRRAGSACPPRPGSGPLVRDLRHQRTLAARQAELRLSITQAAGRAGIEPRYLAYLENFPGHPDAATLRQLAAALSITSAALLGAGQEAAPGRDPAEACWGSAGKAERLVPAECYWLLGRRGSAGSRSVRFRADGPAGELRGG
jgi:transcriptional regulator with XRE-family HTH domain